MIRKNCPAVWLLVTVFVLSSVVAPANAQEAELKKEQQRAASIASMVERMSRIEREIKAAETERAQELGDEAFRLFGQIDDTYLQLKASYQQQVLELNQLMQQLWEQTEDSDDLGREALDEKLNGLEANWDSLYERLTQTHDQHLRRMQSRIAKLRGELSLAGNQAEEELESSRFETMARWEKAHELFLAANQTYARAIGRRITALRDEASKQPDDSSSETRLRSTRNRYWIVQSRLQSRYQGHLGHLDREIEVRERLLPVVSGLEPQREALNQLKQLYRRKHETYENMQTSYRETEAALKVAITDLQDASFSSQQTPVNKQLANLRSQLVNSRLALHASYYDRLDCIDRQLKQWDEALAIPHVVDKQTLQQETSKLLKMKATLDEKVKALYEVLQKQLG